MSFLTALYVALALLLVVHCWIWPNARTGASTAFLGALLLFGYIGSAELLGRPKPWNVELWITEGDVMWSQIIPGEGIYFLMPGPRLYRLPWDYELARRLQALKDEAPEGAFLRFGRRRESPGTFEFHPRAQQELPPKHANTANQ